MRERQIDAKKVHVPARHRPAVNVTTLAESIKRVGLLHPVTVVRQSRGYMLVAGRRRLVACRDVLGWERIGAHVLTLDEAGRRLCELDENLQREELTALVRAEQLLEQKRLYEAVHPQTREGVAGGHGRARKAGETVSAPAAPAFAQAAGADSGRTPRAVQQDVQIAEGLSEASKEAIRGTVLEDQKVLLLELARLPHEQQPAALERHLRPEPEEARQSTPAAEEPFDLKAWCADVALVAGEMEPVKLVLRVVRLLCSSEGTKAFEEIKRRRG